MNNQYITIQNFLPSRIPQEINSFFSEKNNNVDPNLIRIIRTSNVGYDLQYLKNKKNEIPKLNNINIVNGLENLEEIVRRLLVTNSINEMIVTKFSKTDDKYTIFY